VACVWDDGIANKGKSHVASSDQKEISVTKWGSPTNIFSPHPQYIPSGIL